ncbi:MAG: M23 family metallopeptidase, partial [Chloroflexota bacterium]
MSYHPPTRLLAIAIVLFIPVAIALLLLSGGRGPAYSEGVAYASLEAATVPTGGFLELPFKPPLPGQSYTGLDNVMSWFDHEYPLVSTILFPQSGLEPEVDGIGNTVMIYTGEEKTSCFGPPQPNCFRLSGHNGIDYEYGVTAGTVISAAHAGVVTIPAFSPCAQASVNVTTDDGRYQTRYLHLDPDVTNAQYVQAGDYIGRVGSVITRCIRYPHLHFTVIYDWDDDGRFEVDEKVDPYGWLPIGQTDPWTTTFQDRLGNWHTGAPSEWLWSFSPPARRPLTPA